jgi:hypothetical protein
VDGIGSSGNPEAPAWRLWVYMGVGLFALGFWMGGRFARWGWRVASAPEFRPVRWSLLVGGGMTTVLFMVVKIRWRKSRCNPAVGMSQEPA